MTEQEAAQRLCPLQLERQRTCEGSKCMLWSWSSGYRWITTSLSTGEETKSQPYVSDTDGFCGLAHQ